MDANVFWKIQPIPTSRTRGSPGPGVTIVGGGIHVLETQTVRIRAESERETIGSADSHGTDACGAHL